MRVAKSTFGHLFNRKDEVDIADQPKIGVYNSNLQSNQSEANRKQHVQSLTKSEEQTANKYFSSLDYIFEVFTSPMISIIVWKKVGIYWL